MLTLRLPTNLETRQNMLAVATKRPKSFYVRAALERSLDEIEDIYLAEAALERFRASVEKNIPLEELERRPTRSR